MASVLGLSVVVVVVVVVVLVVVGVALIPLVVLCGVVSQSASS